MKQSFSVVMLAVVLGSCRHYDLESRLADRSGLRPPDRFARYGREQAQEMAIAREYAQAGGGSSAEQLARQSEAATSYARTLPDVVEATADPLGLRLTIRFKSGWLTMVTPVDDGKRGAETVGLPAETRPVSIR
jgi:DNA topoisomerase IB